MKNLNLLAPIGYTGYGVTGFNVLKGLTENGSKVSLFEKGPSHRVDKYETELINNCINNRKFFDYNAPCLNIWHQFDLANKVGRGKYCAWPIFELNKFTLEEQHHLKYPDEVIVCSKWAQDVIQAELGISSHVVPLGIDRSIFRVSDIPKSNGPFIFLNVGKWEIRKGHDILVELFNNAFTENDDVQLWLMPHNPFISKTETESWTRLYLSSKLGNKIKILPWAQNHQDIVNIMQYADCGIFPSRAEGWNLELLEMMSIGKPVITTNYSAHTEFCNSANANLVDITNTKEAYDGKWFYGHGEWADIDNNAKNQFIEYMRYVYKEKPYNTIGIETGDYYTWDNTVSILEKVLYA